MKVWHQRWWARLLFWIFGLVAVLAVFAAVLWRHDMSPPGTSMAEYTTPDETNYTSQIIASAIHLSVNSRDAQLAHPSDNPGSDPGYKPTTYLRDVHSKSHGCVLAKFNVGTVPERFAHGVFAQPHSYDAIIRFSSGQPGIHADQEKDARGMAIKLFDVPGKKLMPGDEDEPDQDFILMNNPVFFIRTLPEYLRFSEALGANQPITGYFLYPWWNPWNWHLRELKLAAGTEKPMPASLLTSRFWSASAYALGPNQYVKYSALPCSSNRPLPANRRDPDYLRLELAAQASKGGACFGFAVQPQVAGKDMPIEDTTVNWSESDSPFTTLASITIPPQQNNTAAMNERCENLSFNPWNSLPAHRPVGVMNRVRQALYQAMADFRRSKNGTAAPGR